MQQLAAKRHAKTVDTIIADLDQLRNLAIENGQTAAGVAAVMGAAKILGFVTDRQQIEAVIDRPAPGPGVERGLILSGWQSLDESCSRSGLWCADGNWFGLRELSYSLTF